MKDHTVVVPDLRGIGRSSKPADGYHKKTQAKDIRTVVTALGYDKASVVAHDIGNTVAYAYAATYPDKVERLVVMDAPIPGIGPWNEVLLIPRVWHFNFHGPDAERLVAGRERIYLDRIWNDLLAIPPSPMKPPEISSPPLMRNRAECAPDSPNSRPFLKTRRTTKSLSRLS
jgi:pimeloyl-ACP methyl ester carboxylesterase